MNNHSFPPRRRFESHLKRLTASAIEVKTSRRSGMTRNGALDCALAYQRAEAEDAREVDLLYVDGEGDA